MQVIKVIAAGALLLSLAACGSKTEKFEGIWANGNGGYINVNKGATEVTYCVEGFGLTGRVEKVSVDDKGKMLTPIAGDGRVVHYLEKDKKPVLNEGKADYFKSNDQEWALHCSN